MGTERSAAQGAAVSARPRPGSTPEVLGGQDELWFLVLTGPSQELFPSAFRSAGGQG